MARTKLTASKSLEPRPSTRSQPHSSPRSRTGIVISIPPSSSLVRNTRGDVSDNDNDSICSSSRSDSKSDVVPSRKSSNSKERGKEDSGPLKEPWRHPAELEYIRPLDWSEDRIITQLRSLVYSVPSPVFGKQSFIEITLYDEGDFSKPKIIHVPRGYRVPLMFVAKFQWASLKLVLTSAQREKEWDDYKYDILHLSRLIQRFFDDAKVACQKGVIDIPPAKTRAPEFQVEPGTMTRKWRCHTFDRALARYNKNWLISREEFVRDFYTEFQGEEYAKDVLKIDWSRWALKGHKGFKLTNDELRYGIDGKLLTRGLKKNSDGRWIWVDEFVIKQEEVTSAVAAKQSESIVSKTEKPISFEKEQSQIIVLPPSTVTKSDLASIQRERISPPHTLPPSPDSSGERYELTSNKTKGLSSDAKGSVTPPFTILPTKEGNMFIQELPNKSSFTEPSTNESVALSTTAVQFFRPPRLRKSSQGRSASKSVSPLVDPSVLQESSMATVTTNRKTSQSHVEEFSPTVANHRLSPSSVTSSADISDSIALKENLSAARSSLSISTDILTQKHPTAQTDSHKTKYHSTEFTPIPHRQASPFTSETNMDDQSHDSIYRDNDEYDLNKINERSTPTSIDSTPTQSPSIPPVSFQSVTESAALEMATSMSDRKRPRLENGLGENSIFDNDHTSSISQQSSPRPASVSLDTPQPPDQIGVLQRDVNAFPQGPVVSLDDKRDVARSCSPVFMSPLLPLHVDSPSDLPDDIPGLGGLSQQVASGTPIAPFLPFPGPRHSRLPDFWSPRLHSASSPQTPETSEVQTGMYTPPEESHTNHVLSIQTSKEVQGNSNLINEKQLEGQSLQNHGSARSPPQTNTSKDLIDDDDSDMDFGTPVISPLIIVPQSTDNLPDFIVHSQLDDRTRGSAADGHERSFQTVIATFSRPEPSLDHETASLHPSQSGPPLPNSLPPTSQTLRHDSSTGKNENNTSESSNSIYNSPFYTDGNHYPRLAAQHNVQQFGAADVNLSSLRQMMSEETSTSSASLSRKRSRGAEDEPELSPTKRRREYNGLSPKDGGLVIRKVVSMVRDTLVGLNDLLEIAAERDLIPLDPTRSAKGKERMVDIFAEHPSSSRMSGERDLVSDLQRELDVLKTEMQHLKEHKVKEPAVESPDVLALRTELQSLREQVKTLKETKASQPEPSEVRAMKDELNELRNELRGIQNVSRLSSQVSTTPSTPNLPARFNKETNVKSAQLPPSQSDPTPNEVDSSKQNNAVGDSLMDLDIPVPVKSKRKQHIMLPKT